MLRMFEFLTSTIPGCERAVLKRMALFAVAREAYRTFGEYVMSETDFLQASDFPDRVCTALHHTDLHNGQVGCEVKFLGNEELLP